MIDLRDYQPQLRECSKPIEPGEPVPPPPEPLLASEIIAVALALLALGGLMARWINGVL